MSKSLDVVNNTYDVKQAAQLIGCSEWTLRQMVRDGTIPYYKVRSRIRFTDVALTEWMRRQEKRNCKFGS